MRKGLWSPDEDDKLRNCIAQHRSGSWSDIARKAGLQRCGKSCRRRWMNHLRPDLKREKFTTEELKLVAKLHQTLGNKWSEIATYLVGRTDNDVKNLWNTQIKKQSRTIHHEEPLRRKGTDLEGFPFSMDSDIDHMGHLSFQKSQLLLNTSTSTNTCLVTSSWVSSGNNVSNFNSHLAPPNKLEEKHEVMERLYNPFLTSTPHENDHAQTPLLNQQSKLEETLECSLDECPLIESMDSCATLMEYTTQSQSNSSNHCGYYAPLNLSSMLMENIQKDQLLENSSSSSYDASPEGPRSSNESSTSTIMVGDDTCCVSKPSLFELQHKLHFQQSDDNDFHIQDQKDDDDSNCLSRGEGWSSSSCEQWALETLIGPYEKTTWY